MPATVTLHDGRQVRLGRTKPKSRPMVPRLGSYVDLAAANLPASVDYTPKAMTSINQTYLNTKYGDCVIASCAHSLGIWTGNDSGTTVLATDQEIANIYFYFSPHDQGCVISQVLDYWSANGFTLGNAVHKIDGYVQLNWTNPDLVKFAINAFGGVKIGFNIPNAWTASAPNVPWDVTNSRFVGGHDVLCVGYDANYVTVATWGGLRKMTWRAFTSTTYLDEAYAMVSPDWYGSDGKTVGGLDVATLKDDLAKIGQGQIPPLVPDPTPIPVPIPVPVPVPPAPVVTSLTLEQVEAAIKAGVSKGGPYTLFGANVSKVTQAAITGVEDAWPRTNRSPLPSELAEEILSGGK